MFRTALNPCVIMLAATLIVTTLRSINCLPTPPGTLSTAFQQRLVPSEIVWPSYVAHFSQVEPDKISDPQPNAFVYRIPGESQDISTQMAFLLPEDDDVDDGNSYCRLSFYDIGLLQEDTDSITHVTGHHEFTIFALFEVATSSGTNTTWNNHPLVDYGNVIAKVYVNSTGVFIEAAAMKCRYKENGAQFWLQAVEDQSCELSWTESMQTLSGLVLMIYDPAEDVQ